MVYIFIIISVFFIDFFTKYIINKKFILNKKYNIYRNKIYIYHIKNKGLAYGFLKNFPKLISTVMSISILILLLLFLSFKDISKLKKLALSLSLGGALGNYYDRIKNKSVTDFIYIKYKNAPVYNFADFFILVSLVLFFIDFIKYYLNVLIKK